MLFYDPFNWEEIIYKHSETSIFRNDLVSASPVNLDVEYETNGSLSTIENFSNYGIILVTKTHSFGVDLAKLNLPNDHKDYDHFSCFAIPKEEYYKTNGLISGICLSINNEVVGLSNYDKADYTLVTPYFVRHNSGLNSVDNKTIYAVLACNTFNQETACNGNFVGIKHSSGRADNQVYMTNYFMRLFNGLSHLESGEKCPKTWDRPWTSFGHNDWIHEWISWWPAVESAPEKHIKNTYPNQRYFSITTNDVTSDDAKKFTSVPVSATINGYKNLKAGIEYKIYYCEGDKEFNVTDEGILSEEVEVDEEGNIEHALTGLKAETTYSYRIGFEYADKYYYGERKKFTTGASGGMVAGKAVDLGLSVKWANYNVGASKPEEYGGLYGWGDPTGECLWQCSEYYYGWYADAYYCYRQYAGGNPPDDISGSEWDYARIAWGSPWRMPTHGEMSELIEKCAWEIYTENGVRGAKVTGPNGNAIFLPFTGYRCGDTYRLQNENGNYWTSTLDEGTPTRHRAYTLYLDIYYDDNDQPYLTCYSNYRSTPFIFFGYPIRPVQD